MQACEINYSDPEERKVKLKMDVTEELYNN